MISKPSGALGGLWLVCHGVLPYIPRLMKIRGQIFATLGLIAIVFSTAILIHGFLPASEPLVTVSKVERVAPVPATGVWNEALSDELQPADVILYQEAFDAQRKSDWQAADMALAAVSNPILEPYLLHERYMHSNYKTSEAEVESWLAQYHPLPEAYDIYQLARAKFPNLAEKLQPIEKPKLVAVMGDDNGLAANFENSKYFLTWKNAISAYAKGKYADSAAAFERMIADRDDISPWKVSAAGFWAWRAYTKMEEPEKAQTALEVAASVPRSFYGILALQQMKKPLLMVENNLSLSQNEAAIIEDKPEVRRAIALAQVKQYELAERELRASYYRMDAGERRVMLKLANHLSLPALQIALAKRQENAENVLDTAKFPIPDWEPVGGFSVDPALIYALVRQESGFRTAAISPAGAMGVMQLMPMTAKMMGNRLGDVSMAGADNVTRNLTLGQSYVRHLLENPLVDNNVIFMLAAYNAGIGRLQDWQNNIDYRGDPLLFIERIPFGETRHYVMQVMTNYWLYSEMLGVKSPTLASLAYNRWPVYVEAGRTS